MEEHLGRNKNEILEQWKWLVEKGVDIVVIDMPLLDTRRYTEISGFGDLINELVLQILSWLAQEEVKTINARKKEGILSAKARGIKFGCLKIEISEDFEDIYFKCKDNKIKAVEAMSILNMKKNTFYRRVKELENNIME